MRRLEAGAGFRFSRSILAKAVYQWNRTDPRRGEAAIREALGQ